MKHAKLSPSSIPRWLGCPGSIRLIEQCPPEKSSKYAVEGSAAHKLAEKCLAQEYDADRFIGTKIDMKEATYMVTGEMAEAVQVYLDRVRALMNKTGLSIKSNEVMIERKLDLSFLVKGMFGTCDFSLYDKTEEKLYVIDYKHGIGNSVSPEYNSQLMAYGIGAVYENVRELKTVAPIKTVTLIIVQPRILFITEPDSWEIPLTELMNWGISVLAPGAKRTEDKDAPLCVGEYCKFCPALALCPAQLKNAKSITKTEFDTSVLPVAQLLKKEEIEKILRFSDVFSSWIKSVKAYAQSQMELGTEFSGHKLVRGRSIRKWVNIEEAELALKAYIGEDVYEKKLLSVAKAEKLLAKSEFSSDVCLDGLWEKPDAGLTMAADTDRRAACLPQTALEFLDEADFLK